MSLLFSEAVPESFLNPDPVHGFAAYKKKSAHDYERVRKEFRPVSDESESFLKPWKKRLANRKNETVICAASVCAKNADGSAQKPFDLISARNAVRNILKKSPKSAVRVRLLPGKYIFSETLSLTKEDSGSADYPVIWSADPGAIVEFYGMAELPKPEKVKDKTMLARFRPEAAGRIRCMDVAGLFPEAIPHLPRRGMWHNDYPVKPYYFCFADGKRLSMARYPKKGQPQFHTGKVFSGGATSEAVEVKNAIGEAVFNFSDPALKRWTFGPDLMTDGQWGYLWASETREVRGYDAKKKQLHLQEASRYGCRPGFPFYFFNLPEEITEPGEWYLDRESKKLYIMPVAGTKTYELARLDSAFMTMDQVKNVLFRNIRFYGGAADGIYLEKCSNVLFADSRISAMSGNGFIAHNGKSVGLFNCEVNDTGACGIRLHGGDRETLTMSKNFAVNLHVHHTGRIDRSYGQPVCITGCGNSLYHVDMHDIPHDGIAVGGDLETVAFVHGYDLVRDFDDLAGIDTGFDPFLYGNRYFFNFWHDVGSLSENTCGQCAIRIDDMTDSILIYGNVFYRCAAGGFGAVQIHAGKNNVLENNLFLECERALSYTAWDDAIWAHSLKYKLKPNLVTLEKSPVRRAKTGRSRYDFKQDVSRNFMRNNYLVKCSGTVLQKFGVFAYQDFADNLHVNADWKELGFADPKKLDFSLKADSPLYRNLDFKPIPFKKIGIDQSLSLDA